MKSLEEAERRWQLQQQEAERRRQLQQQEAERRPKEALQAAKGEQQAAERRHSEAERRHWEEQRAAERRWQLQQQAADRLWARTLAALNGGQTARTTMQVRGRWCAMSGCRGPASVSSGLAFLRGSHRWLASKALASKPLHPKCGTPCATSR